MAAVTTIHAEPRSLFSHHAGPSIALHPEGDLESLVLLINHAKLQEQGICNWTCPDACCFARADLGVTISADTTSSVLNIRSVHLVTSLQGAGVPAQHEHPGPVRVPFPGDYKHRCCV